MQQKQKLTTEEELFIRDLEAFFVRNNLKFVKEKGYNYIFISNKPEGELLMDIEDVASEIGIEEI